MKPEVGKAGQSDIIKVQFDRVGRPKYAPKTGPVRKQGFFLRSHGYPINREQLEKDFPSGASHVAGRRLK